ncbi:MAG: hypothetical protein E8D41_10000 [Nitrospira sp.]|nr:MAG: hypothetical protein E8D41_10000 [Nitrospira sp.]
MALDEYTADQLITWYERIEKGILLFGEHVPLTRENETLIAPILASYLLDACGLIDSVFRDMTLDPTVVSSKTVARKDCTIIEFAELHAKSLDLPNTRSTMLVSPPRYRNPFSPWTSILTSGKYSDLDWWMTYNHLKHNRLANIKSCTLGTTLDATCALHQVISRRLEHVPLLIRRRWFPSKSWPIDHVIEEASAGRLPGLFVVQTELFATPVGSNTMLQSTEWQFPTDVANLNSKLSWFKCKDDFYRFLGSTG